MGRQERPLDADGGPLVLFALDLRELRRQAGSPPYRRLATRTNYSASTLAEAASGRRLPSEGVLAAFVTACGGDPREWERRRIHTHRQTTRPLTHPPAPAPEPTPVPATPTPAAAAPAPVTPPPVPIPAPDAPAPRRILSLLAATVIALVLTLTVALATTAAGDSGAPPALEAQAPEAQTPEAQAPETPAPHPDAARRLRPDTGIPPQYRDLIVDAGTACPASPEVTPALIAALLEAESGFDPNLSDPAADAYGIARWTPRALRPYLPPDRQGALPAPPFTPEESIPALGRMLCATAPTLHAAPADAPLALAAAYRAANAALTAATADQPYLDRVRRDLHRYGQASPG
ncbi:helix-turn-helix domain-containing protein [Kitasatospora sp. NPDC093806]|uniref:helix-turn-helix domain-containing protein n=1 Tax=Kitasatospora sp. NPDC093806 TaxID=3155075 RepID=UPI003437DD64